MKTNEVIIADQNKEDEPTREEVLIWMDSEIAQCVLLVNDEMPGEGLEYISKKTKEFTEMLRQGRKSELEEIWRP